MEIEDEHLVTMADIIWLARHANRQDFVDPDWPRHADRPHDPGLSPDGVEQAKQLGQHLADQKIESIFASPYLRTTETAFHVAEFLDRSFVLEPGIGEWLNPEWFGDTPERLSIEALRERFPRIRADHDTVLEPSFPEEKDEALDRAARTAEIIADRISGPVLLVGHGASVFGVVRGLVDHIDEMDCPLCSLTRLVREPDSWQVDLLADTSHLTERKGADRFH